MITNKVQNLFDFIDYLHSQIEYLLSKKVLIDEVDNLRILRGALNPDKNYKDRIEYNKIQSELETKFNVVFSETTIPIKNKIQELDIADVSTPMININANTDLFGKSAQCDHPNPVEVDHPNPEQIDQTNPVQIDHPLSCI
ncbi:MAG: hypothetical protein WAU23_09145 [Ferruginibacter sp.]